jgi:dTDP-glucose pyrophosphorylase
MKNWEQTLIGPDTTLREALAAIDKAGCQIVLVVDAQRRLLGTLSDGDARRSLLRGIGLGDSVVEAMHRNPRVARVDESRSTMFDRMKQFGIHQLPVVDASNVVVGLLLLDELVLPEAREHEVIVMAGGLGSRLRELTRETPKPMLKVGDRPLLETIVLHFASQGFRRFSFAVNYRAEQIEAHFGDGRAFGVEIRYLREEQRLGTAGALGLLPARPQVPFIVTNADLLTKEDYGRMVDHHVASGAQGTMGVRDYEMQVPFGVVNVASGAVTSIEEKPTHRFLVSAGIAVLSPEVLTLVPAGEPFDMPQLFEAMLKQRMAVRSHRIDGYWIDIGRPADFERANADFHEVFR